MHELKIKNTTNFNSFEFLFRLFLLLQSAQAHASKQIAPAEDDDPIVDNNEIDTNNNLGSEWAISIPRTYRNNELRKWRTAAVVPSVYGRPGEMGKP